MKVPTGGIVREPQGMNRCDSGTDGKRPDERREKKQLWSEMNPELFFILQDVKTAFPEPGLRGEISP